MRYLMIVTFVVAVFNATACAPPECTCLCVEPPSEAPSAVVPAVEAGEIVEQGIPAEPPFDVTTYDYETALELQRLGQNAASLVLLERVINADPDYPDVYLWRGYGLQMNEQIAESLRSYDEHLRRFPEDTRALFNAGYAQMTSGNWTSCVTYLEQMLALEPDNGDAHFHMATCLDALGRTEEAALHRARYAP